jgi:hypothetical protein
MLVDDAINHTGAKVFTILKIHNVSVSQAASEKHPQGYYKNGLSQTSTQTKCIHDLKAKRFVHRQLIIF